MEQIQYRQGALLAVNTQRLCLCDVIVVLCMFQRSKIQLVDYCKLLFCAVSSRLLHLNVNQIMSQIEQKSQNYVLVHYKYKIVLKLTVLHACTTWQL